MGGATAFGLREIAPETPAYPGAALRFLSPRIAAWIVAAYPLLLVYPLGLGTENPFFVLLLVSFLFLLKTIDKPTTLNFLLAGVFLGLTALTRSVILPFAGLAILWIWYLLNQRRGAIPAAVAFALTITPWMIRNSLLHLKPTGIETSMGYNLYLGYHPQGNGSFVFGPSLDLLTILDDAERDRIGTERAIEFIAVAEVLKDLQGSPAFPTSEQRIEENKVAMTEAIKDTGIAEKGEQTQAKAPSESISFKDLPPEGQVQMAQQAGIQLSPEAIRAEQQMQQQQVQRSQNAK